MKLRDSGIDWRAAGLELAPFTALALLAAGLGLGSDRVVLCALGASLASGFGWWRVGRLYPAMFVFAVRGFFFLMLLSWGIGAQVSEGIGAHYFPEEHQASSTGDYLVMASFGFFVLTTLASAASVAFVSRHRVAAGTMQPEA
jgi:hypothetical protein